MGHGKASPSSRSVCRSSDLTGLCICPAQSAYHCSWCFASLREMMNKMTSWAHQEQITDETKTPEYWVAKVGQGLAKVRI
jgi:Glycosyltransferase family 17